MDEKELKKLSILLEHWIEHNEEHAGEFREWAEKAKEFQNGSVSEKIAAAADGMIKANESLQDAADALSEGIK
jgi:rubrerythrin